jgi:hypothetical protein
MGGIYEVRRWNGLRCHDILIKFHKDWFRHSKDDVEGFRHRQHGDLISLLLFFQKQEMEESSCNIIKALTKHLPGGSEENGENP